MVGLKVRLRSLGVPVREAERSGQFGTVGAVCKPGKERKPMRQGQQHRRGRNRSTSSGGSSSSSSGHSHNQRKGQNPLSRSFESNGPDVKVRGTAADIASKYLALARDAQSVSDPVLAENYMQHAEHYNRMIIAYRDQQSQVNGDGSNGGHPRGRSGLDGDDGDGDGSDGGYADQPIPAARAPIPADAPPRGEQSRGDDRRPPYVRGEQRTDRGERSERSERTGDRQGERTGDQGRYRDRRLERSDRGESRGEPRAERPEARGDRSEPYVEARRPRDAEARGDRAEPYVDTRRPRETVAEQPQPVVEIVPAIGRDEPLPKRRERYGIGDDQPEFLKRPVKRPRSDETAERKAERLASEQDRGAERPEGGAAVPEGKISE